MKKELLRNFFNQLTLLKPEVSILDISKKAPSFYISSSTHESLYENYIKPLFESLDLNVAEIREKNGQKWLALASITTWKAYNNSVIEFVIDILKKFPGDKAKRIVALLESKIIS